MLQRVVSGHWGFSSCSSWALECWLMWPMGLVALRFVGSSSTRDRTPAPLCHRGSPNLRPLSVSVSVLPEAEMCLTFISWDEITVSVYHFLFVQSCEFVYGGFGKVKCPLLSSHFFSSTSGQHPGKMKQTPRRPCALREGLLTVTASRDSSLWCLRSWARMWKTVPSG